MKLKVLELFSGIGGMHYALNEAQKYVNSFEFDIVRAIDISDVANQVYKHNFPQVEVKGSNICGLTPENLIKLGIEAIFMSPPCQPFTRQGNQKDIGDNRSQPFLHIVEQLIPKVSTLNFMLVENVKGFETSKAQELLVDSLIKSGFQYQEYLICPRQLGIPNSRLRYYLIASKSKSFKKLDKLITDLADIENEFVQHFRQSEQTLSGYIDLRNDPFDCKKLELGDQLLEKHAEVLDIVQPTKKSSCCFTKAYGKYAQGTGKFH